VGSVLRKKNKTKLVVDEPRRSKPFAVVLSTLAVLGSSTILFNTFFNQNPDATPPTVASLGDATTRVTVIAGQKSSRTITMKYDALVEDVQRELLAAGHFKGLVDGVTGPKTAVAIEAYQRANKLDVTGEVSKPLYEHILYTRKLAQAAEFTGSITPEDDAAPAAVQPLAALPKPLKKAIAKAPVVNIDNAVSKLQKRLAALGYDPGSRSGQVDEGTRSAILIFEMDHGLPMQGKISKELLAAVKSSEVQKKP
jgi:peptidoglycan hydrolase-like protein with peptidoglycan-binding domain